MRAAAADPASADYHFNLAVSLKRHGQTSGAAAELAQCLKLRPADAEAQALEAAWKQSGTAPASDPLERIVRTFDAAAFRQAAVMMNQMDDGKLELLSPAGRAHKLSEQAAEFFERGLLLEAGRLYRDAVAADANSAEAHAGLARVRERSGDTEAARKEARTSIDLKPTAEAWLVLARLDQARGRVDDASRETGEALKLDPANNAAQQLQLQLLARPGAKK
jgi:tetratricopeptide (TPR) repeat protein